MYTIKRMVWSRRGQRRAAVQFSDVVLLSRKPVGGTVETLLLLCQPSLYFCRINWSMNSFCSDSTLDKASYSIRYLSQGKKTTTDNQSETRAPLPRRKPKLSMEINGHCHDFTICIQENVLHKLNENLGGSKFILVLVYNLMVIYKYFINQIQKYKTKQNISIFVWVKGHNAYISRLMLWLWYTAFFI